MFDEFYGFTAKPFQLTPDPAFYFRSLTHRKALSYLGYGLAQGEGFIVITGEVGAGKSTLVAHLTGTVDPQRLTVGQIVTSKLDEEEIVHVVAQSFGLDIAGHDKATALGTIEGFLHEEARAGRRCLLIVDESQNLVVPALEELRMLSNFQLGSHPLLQTLLLGQPEFRATLQNHPGLEQLRQRVIAAHHLGPMEQSEVEPYILHRLTKVGWADNPQFEAAVFPAIFAASGGIPRRINQVANRLLLLGAVEQRQQIDAAMVDAVIEEMSGEQVLSQPGQERPAVSRDTARGEPAAASSAQARQDGGSIDRELIERMLSHRDTQIAELQQAVVELSTYRDDTLAEALRPDIAAMQEYTARLEAKLVDQERTIRQTLTMLIEWIESEMAPATRAA